MTDQALNLRRRAFDKVKALFAELDKVQQAIEVARDALAVAKTPSEASQYLIRQINQLTQHWRTIAKEFHEASADYDKLLEQLNIDAKS